MDENGFDIFRNFAHSPKGSAGNLAADDVHAATMALEKLVNKNDKTVPSKEDLEHCLEQLDNKVAVILSRVERFGSEAMTVVPTDCDVFDGIPEERRGV